MPQTVEPGWLSLLPALVTIVLAFATRQVLLALFAGVLTGSAVALFQTDADANPITRFIFPAIGSKNFAQILFIYLWCLGGLIGLWDKTGAARHFAETVGGRVARGRRSSLVFTWLLGVVFHQGGTVSTVLTGSTAKPVADRYRVSHEELSYVVDSTASPIATLAAFNAWPLYVAGLVAGTVPILADAAAGVRFFWSSIFYNFYAWFAVTATLLMSVGWLPWTGGGMARARRRALEEGLLDRPGAEPMLVPSPEPTTRATAATPYTPSLADFVVPLGVLLGLAVLPMALIDENWINEAFLCSVLSAAVLARVRGMPVREILEGILHGCRQMTLGALVLGLAVTLGTVSKELGTAAYVVEAIGQQIPPAALPALLGALCMGIAFATGTSWGTYAVVFPLAMPLAWTLLPDPTYLQICFGAVLGGAVFGDQCSPISDTTILSSMFTGCDLMDHVRTQVPLALAAAGLGMVCSTLFAALV
ncbi:MAG: sodium:proton antiporter [Proteobacteria bacterium]|nr:sodium:proton antiporter [Pseudomonadota bacterium]